MSRTFTDEATEFTIGNAVACDDGPLGAIRRVAIDPVAAVVTQLYVAPPSSIRLAPGAGGTST